MNELRDLLHDQITDPNEHRRRGGYPFVYTHYPNTSDMPTIQLINISGNYEKVGVGNLVFFRNPRIQATVRLRPNAKYDFDADKELETASDGLDFLLKRIVEVVINNQSTLKSNLDAGFKSLIPNSTSDIRNLNDTNSIEKSVDFIARTQTPTPTV